MKLRLFFLPIALLFTAIACGFIADEDPIKAILDKIESYKNNYPIEKVHIQTDKPFYSIGDDIWFKAYVVIGEKNQLSNLSKILYVDLISEKDSIKKSLTLPITSGLTWGDFKLTDSLPEGNYRLRAYTNYMRNFGEEYFFDKNITIGNAYSENIFVNAQYTYSKVGTNEKVDAAIKYTDEDNKPLVGKTVTYDIRLDNRNISKGKGITGANGILNISFINNQPFLLKAGKIYTRLQLDDKKTFSKVVSIKATSNEIDAQFFPESGQLVDSIRSKIGFKVIGSDGLGRDVSGYITDENGTRVTDFTTEHAGIGTFNLTPLPSKIYTAVIQLTDGSEKKVVLPKSLPQGYVLSVGNMDSNNISIRITTSKSLMNNQEVYLIAQTNGAVQYASKTRVDKQIISALIPKTRFPTGILQVTLFSPNNIPVAERLVFIQHNDQLKIDVTPEKATYRPREKVKMNINVTDVAGKPVQGSFSISVTDKNTVAVDENTETSIFSNLLLTSDIKGYIEKPNYYFSAVDAAKIKHLDNLMLTQGWRRFEWKAVLNNANPILVYKPESSIAISGKVTTSGGKPISGGKVTLFATGGTGMLLDTLTDAQGRFNFDKLVFKDSTKFVVQARTQKGKKNVEIDVDRIPTQLVTHNKNSPDVEINLNQSTLKYLASSRDRYTQLRKFGYLGRTIMLSEVKITEKKAAVSSSSNLNGAGNADAVINGDQLQNCYSLIQCLQGRVAGLMIMNDMAYLSRNMSRGEPMQIIVDGMYMEPDFLNNIVPSDVTTIEVLKNIGNTAIYGSRGSGGVLIITTKRGEPNYSYNRYAPGILSYAPRGYSISRKFYSPDYTALKTNPKAPDLRTTIYWNPNIITDKDGKASVEFYNADAHGQYRSIIEGLNLEGKLGRSVSEYTVQ